MLAAVNWLQYSQGLNIEVTFDLNHGSWNDVKLMYSDAGFWPHVLLMCSAQNVAFGSELSPNRLAQVRQCFQDYQKIMNWRTCPVYHRFMASILQEQGYSSLVNQECIAQEVWEGMLVDPVLSSMGERVNLGRFMGAVRRAELDMPVWDKMAWV